MNLYNAVSIAEYIIWYCNQNNIIMDNFKLQKALYFIQAEYLVKYNHPCFRDGIEAVNFGIVIDSVYRKYNGFGGCHIPCSNNRYLGSLSKTTMDVIKDIINTIKDIPNYRLTEAITNSPPWREAYYNNKFYDKVIKIESIKKFYSED